ncbi:organic cation transporter protein-like [Littorina saxatilis]
MLVCGILADRFGRKLTFVLSSLVLFAGGIGIAFVKSLGTLNICRFILGFARQSTYINGMVLGMEVLGPSKRAFAGMVICLLWCLGEFYLTFVAYFIRNWRYLEIAVSVPGIFLLSYWWLLPESPRWLISRGRDKEAMAVLQKIADSNKTPMPPIGDTKQLLEKDPQISLRHVFRSRELMKRLLIVALNIFVNVLVYYGVALNITNLSGDIFVNSAITYALEGLACGIALIVLGRVGRKPVYIATLLAGGVCCVLSVVPIMLGASAWVVTGLSMVGRFFIAISFAVIVIYGAELFSTFVRASAIGTCISFARLANLLSPYLADLALLVDSELKDALPLMVMGAPAILAALLALLLPETRGVNLPETVQDLETGIRSCCCREQEETSCPETTEREVEDPLTKAGRCDDIHVSTSVL